jgi:hypothetical protein
MAEYWDYFVGTIVGWDHLTPQGIRIGVASFIAMQVLAPGRPSGEVWFNAILMAVAGVLIAQAVSLDVH